jgi:hypothetical protein
VNGLESVEKLANPFRYSETAVLILSYHVIQILRGLKPNFRLGKAYGDLLDSLKFYMLVKPNKVFKQLLQTSVASFLLKKSNLIFKMFGLSP